MANDEHRSAFARQPRCRDRMVERPFGLAEHAAEAAEAAEQPFGGPERCDDDRGRPTFPQAGAESPIERRDGEEPTQDKDGGPEVGVAHEAPAGSSSAAG